MIEIDPNSEREDDMILLSLPPLDNGFSATLKQVLEDHVAGRENALVYFNKEWGRVEIFLKGGGWIGVDYDVASYDAAPFCD